MMGVPPGLEQLLRHIVEGHEDDRDYVIVSELTEDEKKIRHEFDSLGNKVMRKIQELKILENQAENLQRTMWHAVEDRLGVSSNTNLKLNPRTGQVSVAREDADHLGLQYVEVRRGHPEVDANTPYSEHFRQ